MQGLSEAELDKLTEIYHEMDKGSGSGSGIDSAELAQAISKHNVSFGGMTTVAAAYVDVASNSAFLFWRDGKHFAA